MCIFFLILFMVVRKEKELLILSGIGVSMFIRLSIYGDMFIINVFPGMPISGFGWIDYLTLTWSQFFLLYFIYSAFASIVSKWQVKILLGYVICVTLFILIFPFEVVSGAYNLMNLILLLVFTVVTIHTARAAAKGMIGAGPMLAAMTLILSFIFYDMFASDLSVARFLLSAGALEYTVLFVVQCYIVARRYNEAQKMEMGLLRSQIRPHFIHNSLATIISISRKDTDRSRNLLMDFSSYLRSCYDYEDTNELIPLEEELEFVRAYAALEQARFGDKLKVEYRMDVVDILVPPLILQPLVENAFIHGLREKEEGGTVVVYTTRLNAHTVRIGVCDDGLGMEHKTGDNPNRKGIGISNINRRLSRMYHTHLVYTVPEKGGCDVYLEIPCKEVHTIESHAYR